TLKHFPGHGNTSVDTHVQLASVLGSWDELQATELAPYREVFAETGGPAAVMSAHLWTPGVDPTRRPATFSSVLLTDVLRDSLRFDGLVITDDIEMGALRQGYSYTERIVEPLRAGADIVLMPERVEEAVEALLEAVEDGRLTEERVDTSVRRVLRTKAQIGLHRSRLSSVLRFRSLYADAIGESVADAIAERAITQPARSDAIPLRERSRVALIQITNQRSSTTIRTGMELLGTLLSGRSEVESVRVAGRINRQLRQQVDEAVGNAEVVVLALYLRTIVGRRLGLTDAQAALARSVEASGKPFIVLTFGHPYATDSFPGSDGTLIAYEQSHASVRAVAAALNGTLLPTGELPVTLQRFPYGSGSP
ncbi:MAG: glycoside hydrolase family 3 N-terminal domain-containing protein, partial [Bacteroidota bacterium]